MRGSGRSRIAAGASFFAKDAHAGFAHACGEQPFGQELQNDQVAIFVGNQAGQLVGLAEAEAAGIVCGVEHRFAPRDGGAQARLKQFEPRSVIERLARNEPQSDLR